MPDAFQAWFDTMNAGDALPPVQTTADWLALRAAAPMRQPAAKANRRRPRPEQQSVAGKPLFEPSLV